MNEEERQKIEYFFANSFNTPLPKESEKDFYEWAKMQSKKKGRDILMDLPVYDLQGYFLSGAWKNEVNGHGTDYFKKPYHPTFSNESKYSGKEYVGGKWSEDGLSFSPSKSNLLFRTKEELKQYFIEGTQYGDPLIELK